jgi:hypothetical protein
MGTQKVKNVTLLGDILVSHGVLSLGQLHEALCKQQHADSKPLGQLVQDLGMATKSQVEAALFDQSWRRQQRNGGTPGQA